MVQGTRDTESKVGNNESVDSDFLTRLGVSRLKSMILLLQSTDSSVETIQSGATYLSQGFKDNVLGSSPC